ncbi:MAG TPA: DUF481 domain-containing protein [Tepidisphaeraceae bacterium]|jgi:putative salt-induced outer membrane protein YdiY|nr:DUF481 domain-containing protein [Tepidisphaeraceae bacterium]
MNLTKAAAAALFACVLTTTTYADEVIFNNGDRLTGTIVTADGGKITIKTAVAGEVKVDMKDVKTFTTDAPIELKLNDGSTIKDKLTPATQPGEVQTAGTGVVQPQPVALKDVKKINPPPVAWTGSVTAGALVTRGNTDTDNLNFGANAVRRSEIDRITLGAGYFFGREKPSDGGPKTTNIDNWFAQGQYDYFFAPKWYAYGNTRIEHDHIADLNLRLTPGVGVGYQWVETPDLNFSTEAGLSYVYEDYQGAGVDEHVAARFAYHLDKKINDRVSLFHNFEILPSLENLSDYNFTTDIGLHVALTAKMFSELKAEWRFDSTPAPGKSEDDLRYIMSLGWTF